MDDRRAFIVLKICSLTHQIELGRSCTCNVNESIPRNILACITQHCGISSRCDESDACCTRYVTKLATCMLDNDPPVTDNITLANNPAPDEAFLVRPS